MAASNTWAPRDFVEPVLSRIRRDAAVAERLRRAILGTSSANIILSYLGLVAMARGINGELVEWCRAQIQLQTSSRVSSDIGYDVLLARISI